MRSFHPIRQVVAGLLLVGYLGSISSALADEAASAPGIEQGATHPAEAPFLAENDATMTRMMESMAVPPTGDADRDFVAMMIPHHQGAIDMAQTFLRYGKNEQLRRLAQEIIVTQQQEIAVMQLAVGHPLLSSVSSPTTSQPSATAPHAQQGAEPKN